MMEVVSAAVNVVTAWQTVLMALMNHRRPGVYPLLVCRPVSRTVCLCLLYFCSVCLFVSLFVNWCPLVCVNKMSPQTVMNMCQWNCVQAWTVYCNFWAWSMSPVTHTHTHTHPHIHTHTYTPSHTHTRTHTHICLSHSLPRAGSGVVTIDPLRFLARCRTKWLNQV